MKHIYLLIKINSAVLFLTFFVFSPVTGDTEFIEERVLQISRSIAENAAETIPEKPTVFKESAINFYQAVDNTDTPRKIKLGDKLVSYQVPLKSGDEFLGMIYITPDGEKITEWPGFRETESEVSMYNSQSWESYAEVPLVLDKDFFIEPKSIDSTTPSFLPRAGKLSPEGLTEAPISLEDIYTFIVHTDPEKIGNYPLNRQWGWPVDPERADFIIEDYEKIPYKNLQERREWIATVNKKYNLQWRHLPGRRAVAGKCLSYAASYVVDWFRIKNTTPPYNLNYYISYLRGEKERGMNPRVLEILYYEKETDRDSTEPEKKKIPISEIPACPFAAPTIGVWEDRIYNLFSTDDFEIEYMFFQDTVTGEDMALTLEKYSRILASEWGPRQIEDPVIRDFIYDIHRNPSGITDYKVLFSNNTDADEQKLKEALKKYGIVLSGIVYRAFGLPIASSVHSAAIIGYKDISGKTYFIYKEVFGEHAWTEPETEKGGPSYRMMPIEEFYEANAFIY